MNIYNFPLIGKELNVLSLTILILSCVIALAFESTFCFLLSQYETNRQSVIKLGVLDKKLASSRGKIKNYALVVISQIIALIVSVFFLLLCVGSIMLVYSKDNTLKIFNLSFVLSYENNAHILSSNLDFVTANETGYGMIVELFASMTGILLAITCFMNTILTILSVRNKRILFKERYNVIKNLEEEQKAQKIKEELELIKSESSFVPHTEVAKPVQNEQTQTVLKVTTEEDNNHSLSTTTVEVKEDQGNNRLIARSPYRISFIGRLAMLDKENQQPYSTIKNKLLSYSNINSRVSWGCEKFNFHRDTLIKLVIRGKSVIAYFNIDVKDITDTSIRYEEVKESKVNSDFSIRIKLINNARIKYAEKLITLIMEKNKINLRRNFTEQDYTVKTMTIEDCLLDGTAKKNILE